MTGELAAVTHRKQPKAARVAKADQGVVIGSQPHMVVLGGGLRALGISVAVARQPARHPQVDQDHIVAVEVPQDVLGPPLDAQDGPPEQPLLEVGRNRDAQIAATDRDLGERLLGKEAAQSTADSLNLGKLRHGPILCSVPRRRTRGDYLRAVRRRRKPVASSISEAKRPSPPARLRPVSPGATAQPGPPETPG
jgi:hypothetical protein